MRFRGIFIFSNFAGNIFGVALLFQLLLAVAAAVVVVIVLLFTLK